MEKDMAKMKQAMDSSKDEYTRLLDDRMESLKAMLRDTRGDTTSGTEKKAATKGTKKPRTTPNR